MTQALSAGSRKIKARLTKIFSSNPGGTGDALTMKNSAFSSFHLFFGNFRLQTRSAILKSARHFRGLHLKWQSVFQFHFWKTACHPLPVYLVPRLIWRTPPQQDGPSGPRS
ncbi:hypothetical protein [Brucella anthropi]|uniref:hypothetical protein n=1 Tax=Brucella anthropi TaxID=529 RepID=UPI0039867261